MDQPSFDSPEKTTLPAGSPNTWISKLKVQNQLLEDLKY
jgi:hypothetical protein